MPNKAVQFLTLDEALVVHERLIAHFGGPEGIRDPGLLESALFRPQTGYYPDLATMAAALFESLLINHPFVDGNKRAAFFMSDIFLRLNGYRLEVEPRAAHRFIVDMLAEHNCSIETLRQWIARHLVEL